MSLLAELKQRKLVQWALAYVAAAFALLQGIDIVATRFDWPAGIERGLIVGLCIGFFVALVVAWYHGERGAQRVTGMEISLLAVLLAIGGGLLWWFAPSTQQAGGRQVSVQAPAIAVKSKAMTSQAPVGVAMSGGTIPAKSIAVLPFENLSADKDNKYFADGMQDMILTGLARIGDLKVIARSSTARYTSHPGNLAGIGKQLGVATFLEGSVQKAGNEVLINVQLIDARNESHIWAENYQRTLDNVFDVEGEVAEKIAGSLQAVITKHERTSLTTRPTGNPAAYRAYLKARALLAHSTFERANVQQIIDAFQEVVTMDPGFGLAWAELVQQQVWMYWEGFDPTPARLATAKAALDRAVALAPDAPQVELAKAWYLYYGQRDFASSLVAFRNAQRGLPNDVSVWAGTGFVERRLGHLDAAVADFQQARVLNPNDVTATINLGQTLIAQRRFSEAMAAIDAGLALKADDPLLVHLKLFVLWSTGRLDVARQVLAARHSQTASSLADRGYQALYRRDYAAASEWYRRAVEGAGNVMTPASFGGYIAASIDWQLQWALAEQRRGARAKAVEIYRQVQAQTRTALASRPGNLHVEVALRMALAEACAGLGQHEQAATQGRRGAASIPPTADKWEGSRWRQYLARIHAMNSDATHAVPLIADLVDTQGTNPLTPAMLRLDPVWDPIRKSPQFQALLKKYAASKPVTVAETGSE